MASKTEYPVDHPLDPLSPDEIDRARDILEREHELSGGARYIEIGLDEPPKAARRSAESVDRRAKIVIRDKDEEETYEGLVSLDEDTVLSWNHLPDAQPRMVGEEFVQVEEVVTSDDAFREAVRKRGADPDLAIVTAWSAGYDFVPEEIDRSRRLAHGIAWVKGDADEQGANAYNRPLSGIHAWVDLDDMEVLSVVDTGVTNPDVVENMQTYNYRAENRDLRDDLTPYNVVQPEGPSWEVDGREISWQKWRLRVGFNHREGLVLHDVGYEDEDGEVRPILERASFPEVATVYNDPDPDHYWKTPFDVGEYGIGRLANSLTEGCDCLGYMHYFDAVMNDTDGEVNTIPNAVCLHEEDYGTLWKHTNWRTENTEVRRNRRLVVSFVATVGNYDYQFNWYFYQDGSAEGQVRLTGVDSNGLVAPGEDAAGFAEMLAPGIKGMIHQHFFNFRIDLDIDGEENELYRVQNQTVPAGTDGVQNEWPGEPSDMNPAGQAFYADRTQLTSEQEAQELTDPHKGRYWQVVNPNETNELDKPTGYKLVPGENVEACAQPGSSVHERSTFIDNHIWATPYDESERFPAGEYPNQNPGGDGLPAWTEADRSLDGEDLVLWYTLGVNHITRPEDWPILPVHIASFKLEPVNFFDENPSMDVPPEHEIKNVEKRREQKYENPDDVAVGDD